MSLENLVQNILQSTKEKYDVLRETEDLTYGKVLEKVFHAEMKNQPEEVIERMANEFFRLGPLEPLLANTELTEIIMNGSDCIFFEKNGSLHRHPDQFLSDATFKNAFERIQNFVGTVVNQETPFADGSWGSFRVSIVDSSVNQNGYLISFRRHPDNPWNFQKLEMSGWGSGPAVDVLKKLIREQKNFLVIGPTGCGKTSVMNALLSETGENCRNIIIEDASELKLPNQVSSKLLTRTALFNEAVPEINQNELVKRSLRLRPDRIIMGEIRGSEAKDFLMALATGHAGSFASLHAQDPHQALLRLEMLIQMGAPQWTATAIRQLIHLSLDSIVVLTKTSDGSRKLKGVYQLRSLEPQGFLLEQEALQ